MIKLFDESVATDIDITCRGTDINVGYLNVIAFSLEMGGDGQGTIECLERGKET